APSLEPTEWEGPPRAAADLLETHVDAPPGQVRSMALSTAAFADLETGQPTRAIEGFLGVRDRPAHPKFFLQWYWKMISQLGLAAALLKTGDLDRGRAEADAFLDSALATADPALKARAWDLQANLALAAGDLARASQCLEKTIPPPDAP